METGGGGGRHRREAGAKAILFPPKPCTAIGPRGAWNGDQPARVADFGLSCRPICPGGAWSGDCYARFWRNGRKTARRTRERLGAVRRSERSKRGHRGDPGKEAGKEAGKDPGKDPGENRGSREKREKQKRAQRGSGKGSRIGPGRGGGAGKRKQHGGGLARPCCRFVARRRITSPGSRTHIRRPCGCA